MRRHQTGGELSCGCVAAMLVRQRDVSVGDAVLVIDGDDRQLPVMPGAAAQRFKVRDHQIDFPFVHAAQQEGETARGFGSLDQVLGGRPAITHAIVHVGKVEAENFCDLKLIFQVR